MSRYHSICTECGFEDTNDKDTPEDCGHFFFAIVDHIEPGHDDEDEDEDEDDEDGYI